MSSDVITCPSGLTGRVRGMRVREERASLRTASSPRAMAHSDINVSVKRYGRFSSEAEVKWEAIRGLDWVERGGRGEVNSIRILNSMF